MGNQQCSIQQHIFDIDIADRESVYELQNRISRLVNERLAGKMEAYFNRLIPEDMLLTIDQLSYDIGEVNWNDMEEEIEEKVMRALEDDLVVRLRILKDSSAGNSKGIRSANVLTGKAELLEYFLLTGAMPWWAQSFAGETLPGILNHVYHADRDRLRTMLLRTGKNEQVRKRIVHQFAEEGIQQVISAVEFTEAEYIFQSHKEITLLQKERQLVKTEQDDFNKAVWLFILHYLMAEQSGQFSRKMFIKSNLRQLAAAYNIAFHEVLHIFYDALEQDGNRKNFITLQKFIKEIYDDESEFILPRYPAATKITATERNNIPGTTGIELLNYFLQFGSLPYSFEQLGDAALAALLLEAVTQQPQQAKAVLLKRWTGPGSADHLYKLLGTAGIKKMFAQFFSGGDNRYTEMTSLLQSLQNIKSFTPLSGAALHNALWQYIFDAQLALHNSSFTDQDLVVKIIDRLEKEQGAERFATWRNIQAALQQAAGSSIEREQAFNTIQQATAFKIKQAENGSPLNLLFNYGPVYPGDDAAIPGQATKLKDVLRYLLQYGIIPWWGEAFYSVPVADMLQQLYSNDQPAYIQLFRQAMQLPQMKKRLLDNMAVEVMDSLLPALPNGTAAAGHLQIFTALLQQTGLAQYYNTAYIQKSLFSIAAAQLAGAGYHIFSGAAFYQEVISTLSAALKISAVHLLSKIMEVATEATTVNISSETVAALTVAAQAITAGGEAIPGLAQWQAILRNNQSPLHSDGYIPDTGSVEEEMLQLQTFIPGIPATPDTAAAALLPILDHFLTWHRLPPALAPLTQKEQAQFLQLILLYLHRHSPAALTAILQKPSVSPIAQAYLMELFTGNRSVREAVLLSFILNNSIAQTQYTTTGTPAAVSLPDIEITNQHSTFSLPDFFTIGTVTGLPENISKQTLYKRSLSVLEYFLLHNKLPEEVQVQSAWQMKLLLKEMAIFLFNNDPAAFQQLLNRNDLAVTAKLQLYDLFATGSDIVTDKIARLVEEKRETDLVNFLLATGIIPGIPATDIGGLVTQYLQDEWKVNKQDNMTWLLSSPSLAKMIADKSGLPALIKFAAQKITWSFTGLSIMELWYQLILQGISSTFNKERVLELFRRFTIALVSGTITVNSNAEYSSAFLNFLSGYLKSAAADIYTALFNFISTAAGSFNSQPMQELRQLLTQLRSKLQQQQELQLVQQQANAETAAHLHSIEKKDNNQLDTDLSNNTAEKKAAAEAATQEQEKELMKENSNGFYTRSAGLILFHPFLETFFTRTGLMEKAVFISEATAQRAILLLHYLATEKTSSEEHELVLAKLLCNVPLTIPVPVQFTPTPEETAICAELFTVLIQRWPKMKNATPGGLRESLILRNGVIKLMPEEWNMRVEQKGYDVILQTLPWGFGFIKAKWMNKPLITEWI